MIAINLVVQEEDWRVGRSWIKHLHKNVNKSQRKRKTALQVLHMRSLGLASRPSNESRAIFLLLFLYRSTVTSLAESRGMRRQ